jgi:ADP-heptose:LPS heptosyltransferase
LNKIILFRPGALGDTILAFPALAALRRAFPGAEIVAVGNAPALVLAQDAGLLDALFAFDLPWWAELFTEEGVRSPEARRVLAEADLAVLWLRDAEGLAARKLRALNIPTVLAAPGRPAEGRRIHASSYLLATLAPVLGEIPVAGGEVFLLAIWPQGKRWAKDEWHERGLMGQRVLALHPGSGSPGKCWPPERFAALARRFLAEGWYVLLIEGPADKQPAAEVLRALQDDANAQHKQRVQRLVNLPVPRLAALLARATLFVGNDFGVSHLSAAVGTRTLALFGPTDPAVWAPRGPRVWTLWAGQVVDGKVVPGEMAALGVGEVYDQAKGL